MSVVSTPPSRRAAGLVWHGGCLMIPALGCRMSFRPFTSESYARDDRPEAWRDVLNAVGLQPAAAGSSYDGHATASHRSAAGIALTRIAAGSQSIAPLPQPNEDLPIVLLSSADGLAAQPLSSLPYSPSLE